jgi:exodeoxyribonuclease V gamma subunit
MKLYESNRLEELVASLAEVVRVPLTSPLVPEVIVVQSRGMERWLALELGRRLGVWSNAEFPFPRSFVERTLAAVLGEPEEAAHAYRRECLTWAVARRLPELSSDPAFEPVAAYLGDDRSGIKCFELAVRVADLFDQYAVYRPGLVLGWERGEERHWQAELWRSLVAEHGPHHVAARFARFRERWQTLGDLPRGIPERVSVFGVSTLPPAYVELLEALSRRVSVHFFRLCPSDSTSPEHGLVSSLDRAGRELGQVLAEVVGPRLERVPAFRDPGAGSLLGGLQSDLLLGGRPGEAESRREISPEDASIVVHDCHSPLRELEVLRDQLISLFERDPTLEPHEVVVMTPDLDRYAPLVHAVFDVDPDQPGYIPYHVADRSRRATSSVVDLVLGLIARGRGRMTASSVVDLLHADPVRRRFGLPEAAVPALLGWIQQSGVRWGVDAEDRSLAGQPPEDDNTWHFGLARLLLGYATGDGPEGLFGGVLPVGGVEGEQAEWLGGLAELCSVLFRWRDQLREPRSPASWRDSVAALCAALLRVPDSSLWELELVLEALDDFAESASRAQFTRPVGLDWVERWLGERLGAERPSHDFLAGGVTFCALLPMRSLPFRVVSVLGMDDGVFPRVRRAPSFDLMAAAPKPGDRSVRDEDRQLWLETLLSAREHLIISYVGHSVRDNRELGPSVVLAELVDHLDQAYVDRTGPAGAVRVVHHPLHAHSPRCFAGESRLGVVSYDGRAAEGARALAGASLGETRPFFAAPLPSEPEAPPSLELEALLRFVVEPLGGLLKHRLGVDLGERVELVNDREPIELDALARHELGELLLGHASACRDTEALARLLRASGRLPLGVPGECLYRELLPRIAGILGAAAPWQAGARHPPLEFDLACASGSVTGALRGVWDGGLVRISYGRVRAKGELSLWVEHLVLQCIAPPGHSRRSVLVGRGGDDETGPYVVVLRPLPEPLARERLGELVRLFWLGQRVPLPFFPESARAYLHRLRERQGHADAPLVALRAARDKYRPSELSPARGEAEAPGVRLVFADRDPLDPSFRVFPTQPGLEPPTFTELAEAVYGPLLDALEPVS